MKYRALIALFGSTFLSGMEAETLSLPQNLNTIMTARGWYLKHCKNLIEKGAHINTGDALGIGVLIEAAYEGHKEDCEFLIEHNTNVNAVTNYGEALIHAAQGGHKNICEILIAHGADIHAVDHNRNTALILAAANGHKDLCKFLIAKGANIHAVNNCRSTPFMEAAKNSHMKLCEFLIAKGAEVHTTDCSNWTALMWSAIRGYRNMSKLLLIHTVIRGNSRLTLKEAKNRLFTALLVLSQKKLLREIQLLIILELKEDLSTLVASQHRNMNRFPAILQKAVADGISSLFFIESKKLLEEIQSKAKDTVKDLFTIEGVLNIFPGQLRKILHQKMIDSNLVQEITK